MFRHRHAFRKRMFWRLHAAFVAIALASGICAGGISHLVAPPESVPPTILPLAEALATKISPEHPEADVQAVAEQFHLRVTLWSPELHIIGVAGEEMATPDPGGPRAQWLRFRHGPEVAAHLADGRWLGIGYAWHWSPRTLLFGLALAAVVSAGLLFPLARTFTRRLERLQSTVDQWGEGDLSARASVRGQDEVAELATRFNQAADRVQRLLDSQRRMLASASHELRSPLARVRMAIELLGDGSAAHEKIRSETAGDIEELDGLVGDLLLSSRIQSGSPGFVGAPVDVGQLAASEATRLGAVATGEGTVLGDAKMLRRAVRNLLENARRYGSEVEISVAGGPPVSIIVQDRGPGIPVGERDRIFEPFYRPAGHAEGRDGGVGLGLALVREIAGHHGGTIRYEDRPGGGSRFVLEIPPN